MKLSTSLAVATAIQAASAHTIFCQLNGNPVGHGIRTPNYDGVCFPLLYSYHLPAPATFHLQSLA